MQTSVGSKKLEADPMDPNSTANIIQAHREQEALDLSPGEINEQSQKQGEPCHRFSVGTQRWIEVAKRA